MRALAEFAMRGRAQAIGVAVACILMPALFAAGGTGLTSFYVLGFELGPWQEYLAQELTPDYLLQDQVAPVRISLLGNTERHKATVRSLGLRKIHQTVELADTPQLRGMVAKVAHMVRVEEVAE